MDHDGETFLTGTSPSILHPKPCYLFLDLSLGLLHIPCPRLSQCCTLDLVPVLTPLLPVLLLTLGTAVVYSQAKSTLQRSISSSTALADLGNSPHSFKCSPLAHQISYGTKKYSGDATVDGAGKATLAATIKEFAPGLNLTGTVTLPDTSSAKVSVDYVMPYLSLKSSIALTSAPVLDLSAATSYKSFLLGAETAFDTGKSKVTKSNVALGYTASDYSLALSDVGTGSDLFSAAKLSYAHTVNPTTSAGAEVSRKIASGDTTFALAFSKKLESGASTKVKVDNTGAVTGYYETKLVSGEKVASSLQIQATDLAKPIKFGIAVDLA